LNDRPWDVQGQGWIFPLYTPFSTTPIPQSLLKAAYSDFERGTQFDMTERYHGGVGMVMVIRWDSYSSQLLLLFSSADGWCVRHLTDTNKDLVSDRAESTAAQQTDSFFKLWVTAGPYDELLYIPGLFSKEDKPEEYFLTTTRIYVSTDVSVAKWVDQLSPVTRSSDLFSASVCWLGSSCRFTVV